MFDLGLISLFHGISAVCMVAQITCIFGIFFALYFWMKVAMCSPPPCIKE